MDSQTEATTLHLPRILCLHGGGTNARIFRAQCRSLSSLLRRKFRLVFADAPFPSEAGPDVLSVYKDWGPFKAWFQWAPDEPERDIEAHYAAIQTNLDSAMREDDRKGATGEWVALLGFSQGAKLAGSLLLLEQQRRASLHLGTPPEKLGPSLRFAVLLAGRAPLVNLLPVGDDAQAPALLQLPTIHVHGLLDPGLSLHRQLRQQCCEEKSTKLVEWQGNHRLPIKTQDTVAIVQAILATAEETGVLNSGV